MTNSAMEKLNDNIHYEGKTEMISNNVLLQQNGAPSHTAKHHQIPAERKVIFIRPAVSSKQFRQIRPRRLCSVGRPAAASVLL